jgi:hypothetical protein
VVADVVEAILVVAIDVRRFQPFIHLKVEDKEAQAVSSGTLGLGKGQASNVRTGFEPCPF